MTVTFNEPEEFLEELERDAEHVYRRIVRVTRRWTASKVHPGIHHLELVATAVVKDQVVQLRRYVGDIWRMKGQDQPVLNAADQKQREIEARCQAMGLEVRAGMMEVP